MPTRVDLILLAATVLAVLTTLSAAIFVIRTIERPAAPFIYTLF